MKKKKEKNIKGFTLIELLVVIVILDVIALIAVPQVLKILNKTRLSVAEDSTMGIVKSAETYVSNFMLQNDGAILSNYLEFNCNKNGCNIADNSTLGYWTSTPTSGFFYLIWVMYNNGTFNYRNVTFLTHGIRPVISVNKSYIS